MQKTLEKKLYPSQINSKTISARIPTSDYVKFLQESIQNGISLNDWLLIKIYSENSNSINGISEVDEGEKSNFEYITFNKKDLKQLEEEHSGIYDYYVDFFEDENSVKITKENVIDLLWGQYRKQMVIEDLLNRKREPSLVDIKTQLTFLINEKFIDSNERREYRKEVLELLSELE